MGASHSTSAGGDAVDASKDSSTTATTANPEAAAGSGGSGTTTTTTTGGAGGGAGAGSGAQTTDAPSAVTTEELELAAQAAGIRLKSDKSGLTQAELDQIDSSFEELAAGTPTTDTIAKEDFLRAFPLPGLLGERLFDVVDVDDTGVISRRNYLLTVRFLTKRPVKGKIKLIFDMFDVTRDDGVTREELTTVLLESARAANAIIAAKTGRDAVARKAADDAVIGIVNTMVANAFKEYDTDNSGSLSVDQFTAWALASPAVTSLFDMVFQSLAPAVDAAAAPAAATA